MHTTTKTILASLVAGATLAAAPALYAQAPHAPANSPTGQHMMGGDMGGMMMKMGDMNSMTEACNKMMQSMHHQPEKGGDQPHHGPPTDSDRKG